MSFLCSRNSGKKDDGEPVMMMMLRGGGGGGGGGSSMVAATTTRKGPWTEEEDAQLVRLVRLLGERRWDFLAKVSGLRRTGKSCRLRWVNYLHPGLRRGRITADEERLIVELHGKWGSRWSRIARSLPGRTDNEIKNFWRTRTRKNTKQKQALLHLQDQETITTTAGSSPSSSVTTTTASECTASPNSGDDDEVDEAELEEASTTRTAAASQQHQQPQQEYCYTTPTTMDQLWNEIAAADAAASYVIDSWGSCCCLAAQPPPSSPVWEYCSDYYSLWKIDDQEYYKKMLHAF